MTDQWDRDGDGEIYLQQMIVWRPFYLGMYPFTKGSHEKIKIKINNKI